VTTMTETQTMQVFRVFVRATPERIWEAITKTEFTQKYFYGTTVESTFEVGAPILSYGSDGTLMRDGEVLECDPPRKLVITWRSLWDQETAAEPPSRVAFEIEPGEGGVCQVTVVHDQLEKSPRTAGSIDGWTYILSGLKTLLETGQPMAS
jgi:uncharacterized protein YndB with AHSA1/START domain